MISISLCMIVKNEEEMLPNCLDSVLDAVDEIILVDTGSTDKTKNIARNYTEKVFDFEWIDDFAAARNFSFSHASMDYILWLDADDVFLEEDKRKLLELKSSLDPSIDSVAMVYNYEFDEYGNPILRLHRNRLIKRSRNFRWFGAVHEFLAVGGNTLTSDIAVTHKRVHHHSGRNLAIFENRLERGEKFSSRDMYYYANELYDNEKNNKAIEYYLKFLESKDGWVEDKIRTCDKLADIHYRLGDTEKEREFIFKSFEYDIPRAEFCCRLGFQCLAKNEIKQAIFWYTLAANLEMPKESWGFFQEACWTWLPHVQLCICYYGVGDYLLSYQHNETALRFRPNDEQLLGNKRLLEERLKELGEL